MDYTNKNLKAQMKIANQKKAAKVLIIGEDELSVGMVKIRDMDSGKQEEVSLSDVLSYLRRWKK